VTLEWTKLHNEDVGALYWTPNNIRVIKSRGMKWAGMWHVWGSGEVRRVVMGNPERRRPRGRHRHGWEDNIKMVSPEVGLGGKTALIWLRIGTGCGHL
jgi:hypothetical protein